MAHVWSQIGLAVFLYTYFPFYIPMKLEPNGILTMYFKQNFIFIKDPGKTVQASLLNYIHYQALI